MASLGLRPDATKMLTAARIRELLDAVNTRLGHAAVADPVGLVVVGGAAVAMQWNPGRTTYDVDVVSEGIPAEFWAAAADVGREEGLDDNWVNAAARIKAPTGPTPGEPIELYAGSHLVVYGASPHYVLAMKLVAGRDVDLRDMPVLLDAARPQTRHDLYDLVDQAYPNTPIPAATRYIIDQVWADHTAATPN